MRNRPGRRRFSAIPVSPSWLIERMEQRALFSAAPLPTLADLEDPAHTAIRIESSLGDIDVELFDDAAPGVVAAFLTRIRRGDVDPSFFNALSAGHTLEGGAFRLDPEGGLFRTPDF